MPVYSFSVSPSLLNTRACNVLLPGVSTTRLFRSEQVPRRCWSYSTFPWQIHGKPKQGSVVDSYQTVTVNCNNCGEKLFRYKKKNGTKSNLVKLYLERISEDCTGLLLLPPKEEDAPLSSSTQQQQQQQQQQQMQSTLWSCPNCQNNFARSAIIHGRPALKLVGGKIRMTKR
jgi:ribosomal protein S27E